MRFHSRNAGSSVSQSNSKDEERAILAGPDVPCYLKNDLRIRALACGTGYGISLDFQPVRYPLGAPNWIDPSAFVSHFLQNIP
jgi:hypothetical protein